MPYRKNAELPDSVQTRLPWHAQNVYRAAFNHAWNEYRYPTKRYVDLTYEINAHRVAWSAVKKKFEKDGAEWAAKAA